MLPNQGAVCCPEEWMLPGQTRVRSSVPPTLLILSVMACVVTVAGCACNPYQRGFQPRRHQGEAAASRTAAPAYGYFDLRRFAEWRICWPDAALLVPQPPPDCAFKGADNGVVDPDEMARLKMEYERQCYRKAEKAARDRLRLLQASSACAIAPARYW